MKKSKIFQVVTSIACSALLFACAACSDTTEQGETTGNSSEVLSVVQGEYLYANSISEYSILIRDDANYYENFAANELAQNLGVSTGHALPILTENELKKEDRVISLGHTSLWDKKVGVTLSESNIVESGYYITTVENNIYISCPDFTSSSGVLYGVYDFLYDTVGYEFFAEDEILIEKRTEIPLYDYKDVTVNPSFEMRMIRKAELRDDSITAMRYRMVYPSESFGFIRYGHGQASLYINPNAACTCGLAGCGKGITYQQHHPDWFSNYGTKDLQLCWSGGEVLETVAAEKFIELFQQYPDAEYFMFGQEDNLSTCSCEKCESAKKEFAGKPSGLQIAFMNNVIKKTSAWLAENEPGREVKYIVYAYYGVEEAPVKTVNGKVVPFSDKVIPNKDLYIYYTPIYYNYAYQFDSKANAEYYKNLSDWKAIADGQLIMYLYDTNFTAYLVNFDNFGTLKGMYETCKEMGVACMTTQGADTYTPCFQSMRAYVQSSLMWDINLSYEDLVRKFMKNYYKDAAEYLYEYYKIIRDRYTYYRNVVDPMDGGIYAGVQNSELWTPYVVETMEECFDKAFASIEKYKESDPDLYLKLKNRIKKEELSIIYINLTLLSGYQSEEDYAALKEEFKYYVNLFKLSEVKEGSGFEGLLN
ncbi:MAG: DUF4838 domain-containing protein [Clostridiales bacterium]|nr:DUF4838 domain-containing protein [Clostridiales bacterium]